MIRVWWNELKETFSDIGILLFIIVVPLGYPVLYSYVYGPEVARDVPVVVVDDSNSSLSREFVRKVDASPDVRICSHCANMEEAKELLKSQEVYGVVHIPSSFSKDIMMGRQTKIGVYSDVCSMIYYKNLMLACSKVSIQMNKGIKVEKLGSAMSDRQQEIAKEPIAYQHVQLYNPQGGFSQFMIPPIMMLVIQMTLFLGIGMEMGRIRERNRGYAVPNVPGYTNSFNVVMGRMMVFVPVYLLMALYMYTCVTWWFTLPQLGHYWTFIAFIIPYLTACASLGILLSSLVYRREDSILLFIFMSIPLLFLSGVSWPGSNMPVVWKYVSYLFPSTFGTNAYIRINSMGASFHDVRHELVGLIVQSVVYFILSCVVVGWQVHRASSSAVWRKGGAGQES